MGSESTRVFQILLAGKSGQFAVVGPDGSEGGVCSNGGKTGGVAVISITTGEGTTRSDVKKQDADNIDKPRR
jgi:hypothetical protein